ncbi:DUF1552 domain-containing protein [Sorangium sp. So ce1024]|uniref:DUF1552 domain-containing protein n=1 Tax=Sorangium sp. So ce1024 TaxID=3133327 RepID=UPI003EFE2101
MPRPFDVSRRDILKTAVGAMFLAPLLRHREVEAQTIVPKRLVLVFTPDSHPPEWWPTGSGSTFQLQEPLADFRGLEKDMLFLRRLDHAWTTGNHHEAGMAQLFTGARFIDESSRHANGPSLDQILLKSSDLRGGTPIASIHLCVADRGGADKRHIISYSGPGQPMTHTADPARAFSAIFGGVDFGGGGSTSAPDPRSDAIAAAKRRADERILQINTGELKTIQRFLGQAEREKLELHVESLFELQQRVAGMGGDTPGPVGGACERVDTSGYSSSTNNATTITRWAQIQADIIVNAFTCDRTRVADYHFSFSGGHHEGLLGFDQSWHDNVAHVSRTNDSVKVGGASMTTRQAFIKFDRFWASHVAYLAKKLASIREGNGSMLDNTIILWGVESGTNHNHSPKDMQYLVVGGKNLGVNVGNYINNTTAQSSNKLLTSVMNALGHDAKGIGIEPSCGPLPGFLA